MSKHLLEWEHTTEVWYLYMMWNSHPCDGGLSLNKDLFFLLLLSAAAEPCPTLLDDVLRLLRIG